MPAGETVQCISVCEENKQKWPGTTPPPGVTAFAVRPTGRCQPAGTPLELCFASQTATAAAAYFRPMSAKYYTQFRLIDASYRGGNEFSGVVELSRPVSTDLDVADIEAVLARNFDLQKSAVKLLSWARLH